MVAPSSSNLRERVVKAVAEGASRRQAAERFGVSPASAICWQESFEREGRVAAKPQGGDRRKRPVALLPAPHRHAQNGHWKTTTVTAALRTSGVVATALFDGATIGERFRAYVEDVLGPVLKLGDTVIPDNLGAHKVAGAREAIQAAKASLLYLLPYLPDFNPIEQVFAMLKADLRKAAARTHPDLKAAIRSSFDSLTSQACRKRFAAAGYDAYDPT